MGIKRQPGNTTQLTMLFEQALWNLLDGLRTSSSRSLPHQHLDAIGVMLLIRFQSELSESHPLPVWSLIAEAKPGGFRRSLGEALKMASEALPELAPALSTMGQIVEQNMSDNDLSLIAGALARLPQAPPDIVGGAYRKILLRSAGDAREVHTSPHALSKFICALGDPKPGEWVHDPFAGACTFLVDAVAHLRGRDLVSNSLRALRLTGTEINTHAWATGVLILALHGIQAKVDQGDSFVLTGDQATPDLILSEPPWGLRTKASGPGRPLFAFLPPDIPDSVAGDFATVNLVLDLLRPHKGRAVMNVAPRLLFGGGAVARARREWLTEDLIEAVITLPKGLSAASPALPACLVVFNLHKEAQRRGRVLLVDGDKLGIRDSERFSSEIFDQDTDEVLGLFRRFEPAPGRAVVISVQALQAHESALSPNRYMSTEYEPEPLSAIDELLGRSMSLEDQLEHSNKIFMRAAAFLFAHLKDE